MSLFTATYAEREAEALGIIGKIRYSMSGKPVVLSSFGKDSLVLLSLMKRVYGEYPDVIFWMDGLPMNKYLHAFKTAAALDVRLFTYPPTAWDYLQKDDFFDVIHYFYITEGAFTTLYTGCRQYRKNEQFLCAVDDLLSYPRIDRYEFRWDYIFQGQKECDDLHIAKSYKLNPVSLFGDKLMLYPLYNWSDEDVWSYVDKFSLRKYIQEERYRDNPSGRSKTLKNDRNNPDVAPTCFACLDCRNESLPEIYCPKKKTDIPFAGKGSVAAEETNKRLLKALGSVLTPMDA